MLDTWLRRPPKGMSLAEARLAGLVPPENWVSPRPDRARDAIRTARVVGHMLRRLILTRDLPAGGTTSVEGFAKVKQNLAGVARELGVEVVVRHAERVPATGGLVFMWNQTSHLDHLVLPIAIPRPFHVTYNNEVRRFPGYGPYLEANDHFWIDRTDEKQWRAQLERAATRIRDGACLLVSPEGTRSWDGNLLPMKRGAFLLARLAERPIVCTILRGVRELLPRGRLAVRPGTVEVEFAEPIPVDDSTRDELEALVVRAFTSRT